MSAVAVAAVGDYERRHLEEHAAVPHEFVLWAQIISFVTAHLCR